jgi:hypothetical protein
MRIPLAGMALGLVLAFGGAAAAAPPERGEPPWGAYCSDCRSTPGSTLGTATAFGACVLVVAKRSRRGRARDPISPE